MSNNVTSASSVVIFSSQLKKILIAPMITIIFLLTIHLTYNKYGLIFTNLQLDLSENILFLLSISTALYWLATRITGSIRKYLLQAPLIVTNPTIQIIIPFCISMVNTVIALVIFNHVIAHLGLPDEFSIVLEKLSNILIIAAITWVLLKLLDTAEQLLFHYYLTNTPSQVDLTARKIYTQTTIIKRVILSLIIILACGAVLMLFDNVRALGASVLTTAGIIGLVLTLAAQRSLGSVFSGLEIALTQPIKIGDSIIVDNEFGVVEEINFRNVIIKLWDWRRLVMPTSYFLDKSFQNLSRERENNLIGSIYLYVDFTTPLDSLRQELKKIVANSGLWDGNVSAIEVTDLQEKAMQLRVIASAKDSSDVWKLRCLIREALIGYLVTHHKSCLPVTRTLATHLSNS